MMRPWAVSFDKENEDDGGRHGYLVLAQNGSLFLTSGPDGELRWFDASGAGVRLFRAYFADDESWSKDFTAQRDDLNNHPH